MEKLIGPLTKKKISGLKSGQEVLYTGVMYTARDQAHKRMIDLLEKKKPLPFDIKDKVIYYCGPNPAPKGKVVGSCGPTTSSRMDKFTPRLMDSGLLATIGKGERSVDVAKAIKKNRAIYFITYAGCGALLSKYVKKRRLICFKDLGAEAVFAFEVKDFPLIVAIDSKGVNIYE
ncbi:MAG: fumarate hydratase C-terminal domain-containing protein [Candidatus Omnitrophica bacterium]|nr:fumarate hydratase C-terminal domain-containing protein [Candidatus Omnitrophota bacterium]